MSSKPVMIELADQAPAPQIADAPILDDAPLGRAQMNVPARGGMFLGRLFWGLLAALGMGFVSLALWDFAWALVARNPVVGGVAAVLLSALGGVIAAILVRELAAFGRLRRVDDLRRHGDAALATNDLAQARQVAGKLAQLYKNRPDMRWRVSRFNERLDDQLDAQGMMALAEIELLSDADRQAQLEIEAAARRAAMLTALIPIAFVDVVAVMMVNVRVIRRIAEIYGGRSGFLGSMRLLRAVMAHLVATGAVAIGEDMLEPLLGGSVLGKLSRRFGEGLVNGALTARVGVSALEVCRPLSFNATPRPKARTLIKQSLSGLVMRAKS